MTLADNILKKVTSTDSIARRHYVSPPPEPEILETVLKKKKKRIYKYAKIPPKVDTSPPLYNATPKFRLLENSKDAYMRIYKENINLLITLRRAFLMKGRVDSHWKHIPAGITLYYQTRVNACHRIQRENKILYDLLKTAKPRITSTKHLEEDWQRNRKEIIMKAYANFVLFPVVPTEMIEDAAFITPAGVRRPRVFIDLSVEGARLGRIQLELLSDLCPATCRLFRTLLAGDTNGYGYVGTTFFTKVPGLYWCGGDVVYDAGVGCYAPRGHSRPISAENYHFSHSMPGLVSMRVTADDEVCGKFNITFKPLPQFDLHSVVFARVIRPSHTFEKMKTLGSALNTRPKVIISSSKLKMDGKWVNGVKNSRLIDLIPKRVPR